jgi:hypothetical protein
MLRDRITWVELNENGYLNGLVKNNKQSNQARDQEY